MSEHPHDHPPGLIGVLTGEVSRYSTFWESLMGLMTQAPPGSNVFPIHSLWIADAMNMFLDAMAPEHAWLMILANDHEFQPDLLTRLLAHNVDIVAPLCALRSPPHNPSIFHDTGDAFVGYTWAELAGKTGLLDVETMGGPGVVIRRRVLEAVGQPFFQNDPRSRTNPKEDLYSFSLLRQRGFRLHVDLETPIGHCAALAMYPAREGTTYGVTYYAGGYFIGTLFPEHLERRKAAEWQAKTDPFYHVFVD